MLVEFRWGVGWGVGWGRGNNTHFHKFHIFQYLHTKLFLI